MKCSHRSSTRHIKYNPNCSSTRLFTSLVSTQTIPRILVVVLVTVVDTCVVVGTTAAVVTRVISVVGVADVVDTLIVDVADETSVTTLDTTVGTIAVATDVLILVEVDTATDAEIERMVGVWLMVVGTATETGDETTEVNVETMVVGTAMMLVCTVNVVIVLTRVVGTATEDETGTEETNVEEIVVGTVTLVETAIVVVPGRRVTVVSPDTPTAAEAETQALTVWPTESQSVQAFIFQQSPRMRTKSDSKATPGGVVPTRSLA